MPLRRSIGSGRVILEGGKLRAVLIREGRSKNGNVWTRPVLEQIAKLSEGLPVNLYDLSPRGNKKHLSHWEFIRMNLPPAIKAMLPEVLGDATIATVTNASVEGEEGKAELRADLDVVESKRGLLEQVMGAARKMGRDLGLSIHVPEDAMHGHKLSAREFLPTLVDAVVGFDAVSIPSAGGRILPVLESLTRRIPMKGFLVKLLALVPKESRAALEALFKGLPENGEKIESSEALLEATDGEAIQDAIVEALDLGAIGEDSIGATLEALARTAPAPKKAPARAKKKTAPKRRTAATLEDEIDDDADDPLAGDVAELLLEGGRDTIDGVLEAAKLPGKLPDFARAQLTTRLEADGRLSRRDAKAFVDELKKSVGKSGGGSVLESVNASSNAPHFREEWSNGERAEAALEAMIARQPFGILEAADGTKTKVPAFTGIRQAYGVITGDVMLEGADYVLRQRRAGGLAGGVLESYDWEANKYMQLYLAKTGATLEAAVTTTGFADILTNIINKRLMVEYMQLAHLWKMVARVENVNDFKSREIHRLGEYANLPGVSEGAAYVDLGLPTEETVAASIAKHGGLAPITWESIVDDDTRVFRGIPGKLARAADRTLNVAVWAKLLTNANWGEDSVAFFHASAWATGHANLTAAAYSYTILEGARLAMTKQKDPDEREMGVVRAKNVFCGPQLYDEIYADLYSDRRPILKTTGELGAAGGDDVDQTHQNPNIPNGLRVRDSWELHEVHEFEEVSGSETDVIVAADIGQAEIMEVGFLNGNEIPEIFIQDMQNVGSFFDSDTVTYKVRHVHDSGVLVDPRGAHLIQAP